jgi:hypothetical protein
MNTRLIMMGAWAIVVSAAGIAIPGCGRSDGAEVHGRLVRSDGTPLAGARVVIRSPDTGESAYDVTDADGYFRVSASSQGKGFSAGDYNVLILEDRGEPDRPLPPTISPKYRDPNRSGLRIYIEGNQPAELNVTLDPP